MLLGDLVPLSRLLLKQIVEGRYLLSTLVELCVPIGEVDPQPPFVTGVVDEVLGVDRQLLFGQVLVGATISTTTIFPDSSLMDSFHGQPTGGLGVYNSLCFLKQRFRVERFSNVVVGPRVNPSQPVAFL